MKNKKVLITGGAGFIGSHLTKRLLELDAKVSVIVKYNSIIDSPRLIKIWENGLYGIPWVMGRTAGFSRNSGRKRVQTPK